MIRLHILVEGQTEEAFANRVLASHFAGFGIQVIARLVNKKPGTTSRIHKGGWTSYNRTKLDLYLWMKEAHGPNAWFTTMLDLYALPNDFPGIEEAKRITDPLERVCFLEEAFGSDVKNDELWRFKPYLQLHEFEALLFADPQKLDWEFLEHDEQIARLVVEASRYPNPEMINDSRETAPSKRIIKQIPEYEWRKASVGPLVADKIGLATLRRKCPHFANWISALENLKNEG